MRGSWEGDAADEEDSGMFVWREHFKTCSNVCTAIPQIVCMDVLNFVRLPQGWLAGWLAGCLPDTWLYFMPMSAVLIHLNLTHSRTHMT